MNTYLIPMADTEENRVWINTVNANSIEEAEDKFLDSLTKTWEDCDCKTFDELLEWADANNYIIGEVYDLEEF